MFTLMVMFSGYRVKVLIGRENSKISKMTYYRNLTEFLDPRNISDHGFDIAFRI
jgi:hypothetical protein